MLHETYRVHTVIIDQNYGNTSMAFNFTGVSLIFAISFVNTSAYATGLMDGVSSKMVLGGAQGLILGLALVIYIWVWKPLRKKANEASTQRRADKQQIPEIALAAADGDNTRVVSLIEKGADVNAFGISGETALMLAARNGLPATVRLLLANGANPHAKTKLNNTARDIARRFNHLLIADILTDAMSIDE